MKKETLDKYIGLTVGCLTVIELDHETYDIVNVIIADVKMHLVQIEQILKKIIQQIIVFLVVNIVIS